MMIWSLLKQFPRLFWYSFFPQKDGAYSEFSIQRCLVMLFFWPVFLFYLITTWFCLGLDHLICPRFRHVKIKAPVLVIGIPRSGTTFLHRLLAGDDQRFTTMSLQELVFAPSIVQRIIWKNLGIIDGVCGSPVSALVDWFQNRLFSGLDGVHSTRLNQPEEDYLALSPMLACFLLILPFGDPAFLRLSRFDQVASAEEKEQLKKFYSGLVQRHLYVHGESLTFLSKNPSFTPMLQTLAEVFPDARFIACLRNPNEAVPSQVSSMLVGARIFSGRVNKDWWRGKLSEMLQFYYAHLFDSLPCVGESNHHFLRMENLTSSPEKSIQVIYRKFGFLFDDRYKAWIKQESRKAKSYCSGHAYHGAALGIQAADLCEQFDFVYNTLGYARPETA